jgi:two-component system response regulator YesN
LGREDTLRNQFGQGRNVYKKLLVLLLGITIIPTIVLSALSYKVSINNAQKQAETYSTQLLRQIQDSNDVIYEQMISFMYELMLDYNSYSDILSKAPYTYKVLDLYSNMKKKQLANKNIKNFYLFDEQSHNVLASENTEDPSIYTFADFKDQSLLDLLYNATTPPRRNELFLRQKSNNEAVLSYLVPYPMLGKERGYIVVDIEDNKITHLQDINNTKDGYLFVINGNNKLLSNQQGDLFNEISQGKVNKSYLIIRSESKTSDLQYWYAIPRKLITQNNEILLWSIVILCIVFVVVGVVSAWLGTKNIYNPFQKLLMYMKQLAGDQSQTVADGNEYNYLYNAVTQMNLEKKEYMQAVTTNRILFKQKQLFHLLAGNVGGISEIPEKLLVQFPYRSFLVMVMEIDDVDDFKEKYTQLEQELMVYAIENITEEVLAGFGISLTGHNEPYRMIAILNIDESRIGDIRYEDICKQVQSQLSVYLNLSVSIGIGETTRNMESLRFLYGQAVNAVSYKVYFGKGSISHYDAVSEFGEDHIFDPKMFQWNEIKEQLKIYLRMNEWDKIEDYINKLIEKVSFIGIRESDLHFIFLQYVSCLFDLCNEFILQLSDVFGQDFYVERAVARVTTMEEMKSQMIQLALDLSKQLEEKKAHIHQDLIDKILIHIKDNINKDITLESLAEMVYMHPAYLSRICKSITGIGLGEQMVLARIDKAKELLTLTNESIVDISEQVGYTHPRAFYRMFKEHTGSTPGDYRKREISKNVT